MFSNKSTLAAYQLSELRIENDELRSQLAETRGIAGELAEALEKVDKTLNTLRQLYEWNSIDAEIRDSVRKVHKDLFAALAKWKAAGISPEPKDGYDYARNNRSLAEG